MIQRQEQARRIRREQVERYLATGMTVKEWCSIKGVSASTMYCWMARLRKEEPGLIYVPACEERSELSRSSSREDDTLCPRAEKLESVDYFSEIGGGWGECVSALG